MEAGLWRILILCKNGETIVICPELPLKTEDRLRFYYTIG